ncbi:mitochondrial carrier domain-containing protein [Glomus cerebriforme]|uniref:Mitochondrial carrier domain-containing protein n=1 Tax=Glomus cerebriforme TaxID=658196 RepID=A0A397SL00_9GLOM|nr:mitochondrial carrier domain-containing protein [Glomus cerebriforme]
MELASENSITINPPKNSNELKNSSKTDQGIKNFIFGSIAGMTGKLVEYPFDTVKTRLQAQPELFKGPLDCFRQTLTREGFFGFYRGISPPMIGAMLENASLFLVYNYVQTMIKEYTTPNYNKSQHEAPLSMSIVCFAGAMAGTSASFWLTPIELIKCKLQVQETFTYGSAGRNINNSNLGSSPRYSGPWNIIKHTLKSHNIGGFYRGHSATIVRETAGTAVWFSAYESMIRLFISNRIGKSSSLKEGKNITKDDLSTIELMSSGACAGMAYNLSIFPVDSIKSQMQTDEERMIAIGKKVIKRGFWQVGGDIYKIDGIRGFYRGCSMTVARAAPSSAIIFMTYELLSRRFSKQDF